MKNFHTSKLMIALFFGSALLAASPAKYANANDMFGACATGSRPLADVMVAMNDVTKVITGQIADASHNADSAAKTDQLQSLAIEGLTLCVPKLEKMTDADAKHVEYLEFQRAMSQLLGLEIDLEEAFLKNDNSTATTVMGKIKELQRAAHARFR